MSRWKPGTSLHVLLLLAILTTLVLPGCTTDSARVSESPPIQQEVSQSRTLEVWSWYSMDEQIEIYRKSHPDVQVNVKVFDYNELHEKLIAEAIANHLAPDVFMIDAQNFDRFNAIIGLENLDKPEYKLNEWKSNIPDSIWSMFRSFDNEAQLAVPGFLTPAVTYYRADILEKYGFPTDPDVLGDYMADSKNWLHMAEVLKKDNHWISVWPDEPLKLTGLDRTYFDRRLNFVRTTKTYEIAYATARTLKKDKLSLEKDIWSSDGQQAVQSGEYAMLYLGSYGTDKLKEWAPETAGLWRTTRLPFNLYGLQSVTSFAISDESRHKADAMEFMKNMVSNPEVLGTSTNSVFAYEPARKSSFDLAHRDPFLGGQESYALYQQMTEHIPPSILTPLDRVAEQAWIKSFHNNWLLYPNASEGLGMMKQNVDDAVHNERISILRLFNR